MLLGCGLALVALLCWFRVGLMVCYACYLVFVGLFGGLCCLRWIVLFLVD